ncbi:Hypothetical predicted protein, partial [Paramuricea clavata]
KLVFEVGLSGKVKSKTKVNDGNWHEFGVVHVASEDRFYIYVDQNQEGEKDFSVAEDLDNSLPRVGYTAIDFPITKNFIGRLKKLRYYPSAIYKDLAGRGGLKGETAKPETTTGGTPTTPTKPKPPSVPGVPGKPGVTPTAPGLPPCEGCKTGGKQVAAPLDMVFVVDGSKTVGSQPFNFLKGFAKQIMHSFIVSTQATRVGFVQISDSGYVDFNLDQYNEMQALDNAIDAVALKAGNRRYIGRSVMTAYTSVFQITGRRGLVPRVAIVITTGKSSDDVRSVGQSLRQQKVSVIVVSIGGQPGKKKQGKQLATSPKHSFVRGDVSKLPTVVINVVDTINR